MKETVGVLAAKYSEYTGYVVDLLPNIGTEEKLLFDFLLDTTQMIRGKLSTKALLLITPFSFLLADFLFPLPFHPLSFAIGLLGCLFTLLLFGGQDPLSFGFGKLSYDAPGSGWGNIRNFRLDHFETLFPGVRFSPALVYEV